MSRIASCRRLVPTTLAVLAATTALAAPAGASEPSASCPQTNATRPFLPWLDVALYVPVAGGDLEGGTASWTLTGGAAAVEGNEPFKVAGADHHTSLRLPARSSATTAAICVGAEHPTLRFFARRNGGWLLDTLLVEAIITDPAGVTRVVPVNAILSHGKWAPTLPLPILVNALAITQGNALTVAFRFTPMGGAAWSIDDLYVDPFRTG